MTMNRRQVMAWAAGVGVAVVAGRVGDVFGQTKGEEPPRDSGFATNAVAIAEIAPGVSVLSGPGGNITVFQSASGSLVIDSGISPRGNDVVTGVTKAAGGSLPKMLINTHWHADHVGGNAALAKAGVDVIVSHDNTLKRMSTPQRIELFGMDIPAAPAEARPNLTFAEQISVHRGDEEIQVLHFAPAHTDSDSVIVFKNANVLVAGDLFFNGFYPFIDYSSGGSLDGMIAATDRMLSLVDDKTKIVPGHGPVGGKSELAAVKEMLAAVRDKLKPLIVSGASLEEIQAKKPLADLDEKWGQRMMHGSNIVHMIYAGETRKK